ncbi:hypothetical protein M436DRAFT_80668 [Aureobasidium namibiae CBS 147.97]|uniref:Uncharacterized protein n=1 Tax=Aureobasidium namibiae CBS 147.97 TaxID=1043004 RepID=A0A074WM92_9PEZI
MASSSKEGQSAVANSASAINVARPIRSGRPRSLSTPHKIFTYDPRSLESAAVSPLILSESPKDRRRETVAEALSHLIPTMTPDAATTGQAIATFDFEEAAGPRGSPLTPTASPQVVSVEEDATTGAEASPIKQNLHQQHSTIGLKRKANDAILITPPRRQRQKTNAVVTTPTSNGDAPPPDLLVNLSRNVQHFIPSDWPDCEHDPLAYGMSLGLSNDSFKLATSDKDKAEEIIDKILAVSSRLLKRQRVLIHDYDIFDSQTYKPVGRLDEGTRALRHFTGTLRTGLEDMEQCIGELANLRDEL